MISCAESLWSWFDQLHLAEEETISAQRIVDECGATDVRWLVWGHTAGELGRGLGSEFWPQSSTSLWVVVYCTGGERALSSREQPWRDCLTHRRHLLEGWAQTAVYLGLAVSGVESVQGSFWSVGGACALSQRVHKGRSQMAELESLCVIMCFQGYPSYARAPRSYRWVC